MSKGLSISRIAKLVNLSTDTLKHYEKIGLFSPDYVDQKTSYRYYSINQLYNIMLIKELRNLDFSLNEISEFMEKKQLTKSVGILSKKIEYNNSIIKKLQKQTDDLSRKITNVRSYEKYLVYDDYYSVKRLEEREIVTFNEVVSDGISEHMSVLSLYSLMTYESPAVMQVSLGVIQRLEDVAAPKFSGTMFMENNSSINAGENLIEFIPAGEYLSTYHNGSIRNSKKTVQKMLEYIRQNGYEADDRILFFSIIDEFFTDDEDELLYEVQIRIK